MEGALGNFQLCPLDKIAQDMGYVILNKHKLNLAFNEQENTN
jgi:hypothetical protein